ncbi:unnamed protein product [Closterium sp. NIES-54]
MLASAADMAGYGAAAAAPCSGGTAYCMERECASVDDATCCAAAARPTNATSLPSSCPTNRFPCMSAAPPSPRPPAPMSPPCSSSPPIAPTPLLLPCSPTPAPAGARPASVSRAAAGESASGTWRWGAACPAFICQDATPAWAGRGGWGRAAGWVDRGALSAAASEAGEVSSAGQ